MKIPAIRSKIGDWTYYISRLKFSEVSKYVKKVDDELHKSKTLSEEIQRAISDNYLKIKDYIINTDERFLGALVLAVYDGSPNWIEVKIEYDDFDFFEMGFLQLSGKEKIFPVDGQHRVEGIKAAIKKKKELNDEVIPVVFIGHNTSGEGMQRTRRLFTTLNRYARPVKLDDIIALDEDDVVAIITRLLIEDYSLFQNGKIIRAKQKAIPDTNKKAFTSIITLYQSNLELFKAFYFKKFKEKPTKAKIDSFLKVRPDDKLITEFYQYIILFWDKFTEVMPKMRKFQRSKDVEIFCRNSDTGGSLLFRPIGLEALIKAISFINQKTGTDISQIIDTLSGRLSFNLSQRPWEKVLWNPSSQRMIMNGSLSKLIFIYSFSPKLLRKSELDRLAEDLKNLWSLEDISNAKVLTELRQSFK